MSKYNSILEAVGNTPSVLISDLFSDSAKSHNLEIWLKLEMLNPGYSIKIRPVIYMIEDAEKRGAIGPDTFIICPTSGNTGIALAIVCAVKGYSLLLVMPDSMSVERRKIIKAYGAKFELTPGIDGMKGANKRADQIAKSHKNSWVMAQFENPTNVTAHFQTTATEILSDFPNGLDYIFAGVGTGGHLTGVADAIKKDSPETKIIAVEPEKSSVLSGNSPAAHAIQGIGAGFVPKILKRELIDEIVSVSDESSFRLVKNLASKKGILAGISTGALMAALEDKINTNTVKSDAKVLLFAYDSGERYLSIPGLF